ncbi:MULTISPECIES: DUF1846 domain-containing protein [Atopobiaceae]|uniref:Uncharacterized protein, UPF0371 family n=1 Tax=Parafannyhessea umbonata TaxID=604330 RepID=A0A1H9P333_9ACTN|nr:MULTISPECIES: DUF1846 domain-containing protein [Atopobiaceae]SEH42024.1 Uncharacterized protein, UPF0371 family [Parafannyhessea umbonata]SER42325.1 Uncharacterized protein, UPF0371 family [Parafannyhessea umbonata]SJZ55850.1 Uncharacterized protein, UPF0371 family [Olsenella sp. KH1P3]
MQIGFDNDKYIEMQARHIRERIAQFGGKLYLEFGGKLFDDYHASRVLPGFAPDSKARMLEQLACDAEVVFAINANDIEQGKRRSDIGITYGEDVLRLMDVFRGMGLAIGGVVITRFAGQPKAVAYESRLSQMGISVYRHYPIAGYPTAVDLIVSDEGFGKNDYVKTKKSLVVVTAPGPGSGKLAVCLSQLFNEHKHGVKAGYAKFETFPVWNLPLKHPVNVAYEAATADLDDNNIIDPYHLEAHGEVTVNYNRDVETFPVLKAMMESILGESPYQSPTDMGVNMVGNCICDDEVCQEASKNEIIRRYFQAAEKIERGGQCEGELAKIGLLMREVGVDENYNPAHAAALLKEEASGLPAGAMMLPDGSIVTGKTTELLGAASSLLLNALKRVAGVADETYVVSDEALSPIGHLKTSYLRSRNPRLHSDETLLALSISSATNPLAQRVIAATKELRGCDAYFSVIISRTDEAVYKKLGINVCCEPKFERGSFYHR